MLLQSPRITSAFLALTLRLSSAVGNSCTDYWSKSQWRDQW
jgi:hypothetical protein